MNHELPDVQAGFRKGKGTRDQITNTCWIVKKAREFQKNVYFSFIDYTKVFDYVEHNKLWKIFQVRPKQYMKHELPDVQAEFRKGKGTRDQIANICWMIKKQESSRKTSTSALLTTPKPLTM